jgi:hypothetical protein
MPVAKAKALAMDPALNNVRNDLVGNFMLVPEPNSRKRDSLPEKATKIDSFKPNLRSDIYITARRKRTDPRKS